VYDDESKMIIQKAYGANGDFFMKWTTEYDEQGNEIEKKGYVTEDAILFTRTYEYEYDESKNWIKQIIYYNDIPKYILEPSLPPKYNKDSLRLLESSPSFSLSANRMGLFSRKILFISPLKKSLYDSKW
jgi:hypothetical protein